MQLLEIYPSLIQDRSLDVLWDFLHPFFANKTNTSANKSQTSGCTDSTRGAVAIPSICVTECADDYGDNGYGMSASNLPKISIVGDASSGNTNFLRLVKDLGLYVSTTSAPVHESDVCIFLMNHENISSRVCYQDLVLASTLDIPTLFVKPPGFMLPSPLPDAVIQFALCSSSNSNALRYRKHHRGGSARVTKNNQHQVEYRSGSSLRHTENTAKHSLVRHDSDLIVLLIDGYRKAVDYDPENHDASVKTLKQNIEKITKINLSSARGAEGSLFLEAAESSGPSGNFLSVPDPDAPFTWMDSCDTEFDEDMLSESLDSSDLSLEGRSLSELSEVESDVSSLGKETFYFVANDNRSSGKVVRWPPTPIETHSEMSSASCDTPINFYNLDFENFQSKMDLFDSDSTPEII